MDYTFVRDGVSEKVRVERWGWGVLYKDGNELHQFGEKGDFHQFKEIEVENVVMFTMYRTDDMTKRIDIAVTPEMQFFHYYTRLILENSSRRVTVYVFGWKDRATGACSYHFILPDDRLICSNTKDVNLMSYQI